ncbi:MAG: DUF3800 domain-containing protein [Candidatus Zixiibacteriota bacterium]
MMSSESGYIPLSELSYVSVKDGHYLMALRAYFDGSGVESDPNCSHVTLAAVCASADEWSLFERRWEEVLLKHEAPKSEAGNPYWHTVEAVGRNKGYKDWSMEKVKECMIELFKVIHGMSLDTITMIASSIRLRDYRLLKKEIPRLMPHQVISVIYCMVFVIQEFRKREQDVISLELFFDNNEDYSKYVRKAKRRGVSWTKKITALDDTYCAKRSYPMQAADLLGWLLSRHHSNRELNDWNQFASALMRLAPLSGLLFDMKILRTVFDENGNFREDFVIPPTPLSADREYFIKWHDLFF